VKVLLQTRDVFFSDIRAETTFVIHGTFLNASHPAQLVTLAYRVLALGHRVLLDLYRDERR